MKLQGFLSAMSLVAVAGAAVPACPEGCEKSCCTDGENGSVQVVELTSDTDLPRLVELQGDEGPNLHVRSLARGEDDDQLSVVVKVINGDVSAFVNNKEIDGQHIVRKDGQIVIKIDGRDDIVIPMSTGGWSTFKDAAPGFTWRDIGEGNFVFAPDGDREFTVFQPAGRHNRAIIGINISDADEDMLKHLGIDGGISIKSVIDGTPAAIAGIKANDLLIEINGKRALNVEQLREIMGDKRPGDEVKVLVIRDGDKKAFTIRLAPSASFGEFGIGEQVIDLSPDFNVDIDIDDMLKGLLHNNPDVQIRTEIHGDLGNLTDELKERLHALHIELEPTQEMHTKLYGQIERQLKEQLRGDVQGELVEKLMKQLQGQLGGQLKGRVFGELRSNPIQGGVMVAPRLRLHSGENGVFRFGDGDSAGVFAFKTDQDTDNDNAHRDDLASRLDHLARRIERIEQRLDRLANALEKQ